MFHKIFPEWITSPVVWIKKKLGLTDDKGKLTDKGAGVVKAGEGGLLASFKAMFADIFPEWLLSPIVWIKKKLGLTDAAGKLTDKGAGVVEAGKGGIMASIQAIFADIFPDWLLHPVKWIKTKLGMLDAAGNKTDPAALVKSGEGGIGAMIGALFNNIFPEWIRSPIVWIKKKLGLVDDEGKLTDKAKQVVEASKGGIGAMISALFGDIFPEWITSPIVVDQKETWFRIKG